MVANKLKFKLLKSVNNPNSIHGIYPYRGKISAIDVQQLISQLPNKGMLLDPFCGSGSTGKAAMIEGFRFNNAGDKTLVGDISEWGPLNLGNLNGYFWAIGDWNKKKGPTTIANTLYETFNGNGDIVTDYIKNN